MKFVKCGVLIMLAAGFLAGCEESQHISLLPNTAPKPVVLPEPQKKPTEISYQPLHQVLNRAINSSGYIMAYHYTFIEKNLISQLQILAAIGPATCPDQFKTDNDKLAYWYNARAAWVLKLSMMHHKKLFLSKNKTDYSETIRLMGITTCPIDGKRMTLGDIDHEIKKIGGFMAEIAAPGGTLDRAPMPQSPFQPTDFPGCLKDQFNSFVNSTSRFVCNYDKRTWYIPRVVWKYKKELSDIYQTNYPTPQVMFASVLSSWASGAAKYRLQNNVGYRSEQNPKKITLAIIKE